MNQIEEIKMERKQVADLMGGACAVCAKKFGKAFHFHHITYRQGEKTHKDFKASKSIKNWIAYNKYILPIIKQHLCEFALLCQKHHRFVEMLITLSAEKFENLIKLAKRSRH